ncbi:MAG: RDD family protein [Chloroflexota bacterium]
MFCRRCGANNQVGALLCHNCQAPLETKAFSRGEAAGADKAVSLDDLIEGSPVVSRHLHDPEASLSPPPPSKLSYTSSVEMAISVTPPPVEATPLPTPKPPNDSPPVHPLKGSNLRAGYLNYLQFDTGLLVLAKFATFRQRIGAAVYDNLLLATIIAFPGAILVLYLASQDRFILLPYRSMLEDVANSFVRPVTVGFVLLFTLLSFFYDLLLTTLGGQTSGKRYVNIRVTMPDGGSPSLATAFFRTLYGLPINLAFCAAVYFERFEIALLSLPFLLGLVLAFFNPTHQGLHDKLAHTYVVHSKEMIEDTDF